MKWYGKVLLSLGILMIGAVVVLTLVICAGSLWGVFATITDRPGLNGSMHLYYNMSPLKYSLLNIAIALCTLPIILSPILYVRFSRSYQRTRVIMIVICAILGILLIENYMEGQFVGKA